ncbi:isochorismatase family protein [Variovorax sp. PAMC26660]|uniref:isochorismatase family protein n=1 Tax=Variovorax sp. PAMC26660 TaxID=2762322 RepID=UPI00164D5E9F|nr:isochorismatase family protein [Variovorax sp. PAMC26660]QNK70809.1 isochorismatase family protein [Variovorax sp. PAMC26660]
MEPLALNPRQTALISIDLQHSNVGRQLAPHAAADVVQRSKRIADALRAAGGTVVWVRVDVTALLSLPADASISRPPGSPVPPPEFSQLVPELQVQDGDVLITKRQWGAFYGTDLDQQLRRRGIKTLVMSGIATNFGVDSTARAAFDRGYELVFVEDAMSSLAAELHHFANKELFPRMGRVRSTDALVAAIGSR